MTVRLFDRRPWVPRPVYQWVMQHCNRTPQPAWKSKVRSAVAVECK